MTCIVDTASINLTVAAGQLSADLTVDPGAGLSPNPLIVNAAGVYVIGSDGWIPLPTTLAFSSADGHTYVATTSADLRSFIGAGDKIRLVQSGVAAYFFVTAIAAGTITLYGGTDYVLAALPITLPYFSKMKSPIGFPLDPVKWTEQLKDTSDRSQASPVNGTWYNLGSLLLAIPLGVWDTDYEVQAFSNPASSTAVNMHATLSTANNSDSDPEFHTAIQGDATGLANLQGPLSRRKPLTLAVKTTYFLNAKTGIATTSTIQFLGSSTAPTFIRARCAYLS